MTARLTDTAPRFHPPTEATAMLTDPCPGQRVKVADKHSRKFGRAGTVIRWSPPTAEVKNMLIYVKVDGPDERWILPYFSHQLEPIL